MAITGFRNHADMSFCDSLAVVAPSGGYTAGQMVKVEDTVGIVMEAALVGVRVAILIKSPAVTAPCLVVATGQFVAGDKVYYKSSGAELTVVSSGNTLCGIVRETGAVGDEELVIMLDGTLGIIS